MTNIKVLLLQERFVSYRIPIYNIIAEKFDFTLAYTKKDKDIDIETLPFKSKLLSFRSLKGFKYMNHFRKLCNNYDVVITLPHFRCINFCLVPFYWGRKYKTITWSIGVRASYKRKYNIKEKMRFSDKLYERVMKAADANIFYTKEPIEKWVKRGHDRNKFFVAHNTVEVLKTYKETNERDSILFVGTLYKEKGLDVLIRVYSDVYCKYKTNDFPSLDIIGEGNEKKEMEELAKSLPASEKIHFHGAIFDEKVLSDFFGKAVICISPNQAGLSVLKSMGYGVPYATHVDAITGGEILNISDRKNGFLYKSINELKEIIESTYTNKNNLKKMGKSAHEYYFNHTTPQNMAQGVIDAIYFALNKNE